MDCTWLALNIGLVIIENYVDHTGVIKGHLNPGHYSVLWQSHARLATGVVEE